MADIVKHFNIAGNYIDKQYVAVQNILVSAPHMVYYQQSNIPQQQSQPTKSKTVTPKRSPHFFVTPSFIYKYNSPQFNPQQRITILFQYLCKEYEPTKTWIDTNTNPDDFLSLFMGRTSDAVIVWTAPKQRLFGLFKRMKERKIITASKGYGVWKIVQNHFSDWHGNMFLDFNKEHMPQEPAFSAIETFIDILDPAHTPNDALDEYAKKIGISFGKR